MDPVAEIALWTILFVGTHLVISSAAVRDPLVRAVGDRPFRGIYSLVAFATIIPMIIVFARHKHAGAMLWNLRGTPGVRGLTWLLMFIALILFVAGLMNPNPGALGAPQGVQARGVLKLTRHPSFVAIATFGIAHMLMNGWLGDVIFFGGFAVLGIVGGIHQDRRKIHELGEPYRRFMAETSFFPGTALWRGRVAWSSADVPWAGIGVGVAVAVLIVISHTLIFGGRPLG